MVTLCGAYAAPASDRYGHPLRCTRDVGHEGDHIAAIGPYVEGEVILAQWPAPPKLAFHAHLDDCQQCHNHPLDLCPIGARLLREAVDASDRP